MKWLAILLFAVLGQGGASAEVLLHRDYSAHDPDRRTNYRVPREAFEQVPEWSPESKRKAPLGKDQAVGIALAAAAKEAVATKGKEGMVVTLCETNRYEKSIVKRLPARGCRWFYLVQFERAEGKGDPVCILVTMSGAVARKEVVPRK